MQTIIFSLILFSFCLLAMAIGVLFGSNKPIKGSCGGIASGNPDESCGVCGGSPAKCESSVDDALTKPEPDKHYSQIHKSHQVN